MQPSAVQALNVQNQQQAQVTQPQVAQQAFAAAMQRTASIRPSQVQAPQPRPGVEKAELLGQDRGESARRKARRSAGGAGKTGGHEAGYPEGSGSRLDIVA